MYTKDSRRKTGSILAPPTESAQGREGRRRRTWTHTRPGCGRGAHAVEFSKTVAPPSRRGILLRGTSRSPLPDPGATTEYITCGRIPFGSCLLSRSDTHSGLQPPRTAPKGNLVLQLTLGRAAGAPPPQCLARFRARRATR
jgi:hypothetical protein